MNAPAEIAASRKKKVASSSPPRSFGASPSASGDARRRAKSSTTPATSQRQTLLMQPPPDHQCDSHERRPGDEPRDEPFRHRPDVADPPAALVHRMLRVEDVADDRVQLAIADLRA